MITDIFEGVFTTLVPNLNDAKIKRPNWTIIYQIKSLEGEEGWMGKSWEFFNDKGVAERRYHELVALNLCPVLRPFDKSDDSKLNVIEAYRFA